MYVGEDVGGLSKSSGGAMWLIKIIINFYLALALKILRKCSVYKTIVSATRDNTLVKVPFRPNHPFSRDFQF